MRMTHPCTCYAKNVKNMQETCILTSELFISNLGMIQGASI